jgi:tRNA nucleotidyltransferase (CCA-adding enzyme)
MPLASALKEAKKLAVPTADERMRVNSLVKEVISKVSKEIARQKMPAKIVVGGSVAKGTWLPGVSDMDFFILFNYDKFSDKSAELSNISEKVLRKVFRGVQRLGGSRDYFSANYKGYSLEFVPVLDISGNQEARNITDFSPLHVSWVVKKARSKDDIRLAKQFMKSCRVYGAESYISGFSGHVVDILVAHYGSFEKLLKAAAKWNKKEFLDPAKHYKNSQEAMESVAQSKIIGPLFIVDPIEKGRNAAAALGKEKYDIFRAMAKKFLSKSSIEFFHEKFISVESLRKKVGNRSLIVFEVDTPKGKPDIIGARMKHVFEQLEKRFMSEDFQILEKGWEFNHKTMFWFYCDSKSLGKTKIHLGPPVKLANEHIMGFKKAWKGHKIVKKKGRYAVELGRKFVKPEELAKALAKEFKLTLAYGK